LRSVILVSTTRKGKKMKTATKSSFTEFITNDEGRNPIYSFMCNCKDCKNIHMVKVNKHEAPAIAQHFGFPDEMTLAEFDNLHHTMVQKLGNKK